MWRAIKQFTETPTNIAVGTYFIRGVLGGGGGGAVVMDFMS